MNSPKNLFFIALLPPQEVSDRAHAIKQHFADRYNSRAALKSPPHITLQPPFPLLDEEIAPLRGCLSKFANSQARVKVTLDGFAAFPPRVIYINVVKTQPLLELQSNLASTLATELKIIDAKAKSRSFSPHMTVGFKDLSKPNFKAAWAEFQHQQLDYEFVASDLTLLKHNSKRWEIEEQFPVVKALNNQTDSL
ncbi:2'-5' RNA ligase family protein [Aliterella atlantica]|uniref:2'-5' RNA ligase n=1 Tax=Aliterella atlantica CENA595 TaxID=1618023 RepID=A0A0D8ZXW5_9CYAN|nr:2'-5' RNA ligase family protein [Aliterella atlantica]KJH72061.1 2'-5' RNA ligase [Aliterella atlantica CENA595]